MWRLFLLSFIWGWSFLFIKVAGDGLTPVTVAWLRVALGALALVLLGRAMGVRLPSGAARWRNLTIAAVLANAMPFTLLVWATEHIATGLTAVLNASTPLFTALAAAAYLHERLKRFQRLGLVVGFVGVAIAAGVGGSDLADSSLLGALAAIAAGACYGVSFVFMRRNLTDIPPLAAATGQLLVGTALLAPLAIVTSVVDRFDPTPTRVLAVVLLGVVGTGVAYVLNYRLLADLGPTKTSLSTYIIPVVAVVLGVIFLDEPFSLRIVVGGAVIAVGVALVHERVFGRRGRLPVVPTAAVVLALVLVTSAAACGDDDGEGGGDGEAACGRVRTEALDPNSTQHVLAERAGADLPLGPPDLRPPPARARAVRRGGRAAVAAGAGRAARGGRSADPARRRARTGDGRRAGGARARGGRGPEPGPAPADRRHRLAAQARVRGRRPGRPARLRRSACRWGRRQSLTGDRKGAGQVDRVSASEPGDDGCGAQPRRVTERQGESGA